MKKINLNTFLPILFIFLVIAAVYLGYQKEKQAEKQKEISKEIRKSESIEKNYKDSLLALQYSFKEADKKEKNLIYTLTELTRKYKNLKKDYDWSRKQKQSITPEKINNYTDTLCKQDVLILRNYLQKTEYFVTTLEEKLNLQDSLINYKNIRIENQAQQIDLSKSILTEKEKQMQFLQNSRPKKEIISIGLFTGAGIGVKSGITPMVGVGLSLNLIPLLRK